MNALLELRRHNQSAWLDYIWRDLVLGGELKRLVEQDGLGGVTSNPTIFERAIDGGGLMMRRSANPSRAVRPLSRA